MTVPYSQADADVFDVEDVLGDEFDLPPSWVNNVANAIGATFPAGQTRGSDVIGPQLPLQDVPLDQNDPGVGGEESSGADDDPDEQDAEALLEAMARDVERMDAVNLADAPGTVAVAATWKEIAGVRPRWVVELVEGLLRNDYLRRDLVEKAEDRMLGGIPPEHRDPALIGAAWEFAGRQSRRGQATAWLRRVRNEMVAVLHRGNAYQHQVPKTHPENMKGWRPKGGRLVINEVASGSASFGHPALLEHTPVKVVYHALKTWQMGQGTVLDVEDADPDGSTDLPVPTYLDATAGSGTVADYISCVQGSGGALQTPHGHECVSIDLTPMSERVEPTDLRQLGFARSVRDIVWLPRFDVKAKWEPALSIAPVDLVFFDPPSRGRPTHAELYAGARPEADLASFHRDDYVAAAVTFVKMAVNVLKPGGYIVYLVRHGVRDRQKVIEDNRLVVDLKAAFGPSLAVERQIAIQYKRRVPQVSLGVERVPATLLMLRRAP